MEPAIKKVFPQAKLVTDRFHVVRLAMEALQHIRVNLKWQEIDKENEVVKTSKEQQQKHVAEDLEMGIPKTVTCKVQVFIGKEGK